MASARQPSRRQPHHGRTSKAADSDQGMKVGVERDHGSVTLHSQCQDVLVLRSLHAKFRHVPALNPERTKQWC